MNNISTTPIASWTEPQQRSFSERYTEAASYSFVAAIISRLLTFLQPVILARYLGKEFFGIFSIVMALAMMLTGFAAFGQTSALAKFLPEYLVKDRKRAAMVLVHCVLVASTLALLVGVMFLFSAPLMARSIYHRPDLASYFRLAAAIVVALSLFSVGTSMLMGFQSFDEYGRALIGQAALQLAAVWVGVAFWGLTGALIGITIGAAAGLGLVMQAGKDAIRKSGLSVRWKEWSWPVMREILNFSVPAHLSGLVVAPAFWAANTALAVKSGFAEVGLFNVAFVFWQLVLFVPQNLSVPALPFMSEMQATVNWERFSRAVSRNLRAMWAVALPICFICSLLARPVVHFLYGPQYAAAADLVLLITFAALWVVISSAIGYAVASLGKMWEALALNSMWAVTMLGLVLWWVGGRGSKGLAAAYFVSYLLFALVVWQYSERWLGVRYARTAGITLLTMGALVLAYGVSHSLATVGSCLVAALLAPFLIMSEWKWILDENDRNLVRQAVARLGLAGKRWGRNKFGWNRCGSD